jgi:hypothetical protein
MMEFAITILLVVTVGWGILIYNRLITDKNRIKAAWSDIDVQLKRRHDLIPQLVELVKSYAAYERKTLEDITALRSKSEVTKRVEEIGQIESELVGKVELVVARGHAARRGGGDHDGDPASGKYTRPSLHQTAAAGESGIRSFGSREPGRRDDVFRQGGGVGKERNSSWLCAREGTPLSLRPCDRISHRLSNRSNGHFDLFGGCLVIRRYAVFNRLAVHPHRQRVSFLRYQLSDFVYEGFWKQDDVPDGHGACVKVEVGKAQATAFETVIQRHNA